MGRNAQANRDVVKNKIANKKRKEQDAVTKRTALLKEMVNQMTLKNNPS